MGRQLQQRAFKRKVLVAFLILAAAWIIYVKLFRYKIYPKKVKNTSNDQRHEYYESYIENTGNLGTEKSILSSKEYPAVYPLDSKYVPKTIPNVLQKVHGNNKVYIKKLKEMLKGDDLSKDVKFEDDFLRAYITTNNYDVDQAFYKIKNFLNLRVEYDELFHNISYDFTQNPAYRFITLLPHRNKDGSVIFLLQLGKWDPHDVPLVHLKRLMFMIYMQALRNPITQVNGFTTIYDFKDIGWKHFELLSYQHRRLLSHVYYEVMPIVFAGIHIVNLNFFASLIMPLITHFLPTYIEEILFIHSSQEELLDFFPTSALPAEYGGDLKEFYAADWMRRANEQNDNYPPGGQKNVFAYETIN